MSSIAFINSLFWLVVIYFIPFLFALCRGHNNKLAIFLLNLILGWTVLGWIVALIWSATSNRRRDIGAI